MLLRVKVKIEIENPIEIGSSFGKSNGRIKMRPLQTSGKTGIHHEEKIDSDYFDT